MAEFPGFTIWTDAYLADTGHLSTLEHGAYLLLLVAMWRAGGYLPNDDTRLARFCRASEKDWAKVRPAVMDFFTVEGDKITQGRLQEELEKARSRSKKAAESARSKYRKTNEPTPANASPEDSSNPASISTSISIEKKAPTSPKKNGTRIGDFEPDQDWAVNEGMQPIAVIAEVAKFKDYWLAAAGAKGVKLDWPATWRNWVRSYLEKRAVKPKPKTEFQSAQDRIKAEMRGNHNDERTRDDQQPDLDLRREDFYRS